MRRLRIEPLRGLEALAVESSGLTRIDDSPLYRLALVLRNRGAMPLLTPAIDLALTDAAGELVARRVLSAADFGAARATPLAPRSELPLQAAADVGRPAAHRLHDRDLLPLIRSTLRKTSMSALICGSLAFDTITTFPGRFAQQILPEQVHILNVSFLVPTLRREFGGCAGNIAYTLQPPGRRSRW